MAVVVVRVAAAVQLQLLDAVVVVVGRLRRVQRRRRGTGRRRLAPVVVVAPVLRAAEGRRQVGVGLVVAAEAELLAVHGMHKLPQLLVAQRLSPTNSPVRAQ